MAKFSLLQLLMGISLLAIMITLVMSEGCGSQFDRINALAFSNDDSQIMVSKIRGRSFWMSGTRFSKHVSRTISWLDTSTGSAVEVVRQDYKQRINQAHHGNFDDKVILNPSNNAVTAIDFAGVNVCVDLKTDKWMDYSSSAAKQLNYSGGGRYLAVLTLTGLKVIELETNSKRLTLPRMRQFNWCMFSDDESKIIVSQGNSTNVWDLKESILIEESTYALSQHDVDVLALGPEGTLIVCRNGWLELCSTSGKKISGIVKGNFLRGCISADKKVLAVDDSNFVHIVNLDSNSIRTSLPSYQYMEPLALNSDGSQLALGRKGSVLLIDTKTGDPIWSRSPPSRFGNPCYLPVGLLLIWCFIANRIWVVDKLNFYSVRRRNRSPHALSPSTD